MKVFQNRHPDIHANAFIAFFSFAVIIVLTLLGIVSYFSVIAVFWEKFQGNTYKDSLLNSTKLN